MHASMSASSGGIDALKGELARAQLLRVCRLLSASLYIACCTSRAQRLSTKSAERGPRSGVLIRSPVQRLVAIVVSRRGGHVRRSGSSASAGTVDDGQKRAADRRDATVLVPPAENGPRAGCKTATLPGTFGCHLSRERRPEHNHRRDLLLRWPPARGWTCTTSG